MGMARYVYHGVREPKRVSLAQRMWHFFFPPRPVLIRTSHFPSREKEVVTSSSTLLKTYRASMSKIGSTVHVSREPRRLLEFTVIGIGGAIVLASVAYWGLSRDTVFLTRRQRTMAFSWDLERKIFGSRIEQNNIQRDLDLGRRIRPEEDVRSAVVHEIATRLIQVAEEDFPDIRGKLDWHVVVRENATINAFCEPGGSLTVFTGLVDCMVKAQIYGKVQNARDAIAAVVAHEISHGLARHGMEKLSWLPIQLPFFILTPDVDILWESFNLVFKLPHSRECESEADEIGVNLMARAGFDPQEAPRMFRVLNSSGKLFEWISTHPVGETRAREVEEVLLSDLDLFQKNSTRFSSRVFVWPDLVENQKRLEMLRLGARDSDDGVISHAERRLSEQTPDDSVDRSNQNQPQVTVMSNN